MIGHTDPDKLIPLTVSPFIGQRLEYEEVNGIAVGAAATHSVISVAANDGIGSLVGQGGTAAVNLLLGSTKAYIDETQINKGAGQAGDTQAVYVRAVDIAHNYGGGGTLGAGLIYGGGAGAAADVFARDTEAYITDSTVSSKRAVDIGAFSARKLITVVVSGSVGAGILTGASAVDISKGSTKAYLKSSTVTTGDLHSDG